MVVLTPSWPIFGCLGMGSPLPTAESDAYLEPRGWHIAVEGRDGDSEATRDRCNPEPWIGEHRFGRLDVGRRHFGSPPTNSPLAPGRGEPSQRSLADQAPLEFGEHAEHVETRVCPAECSFRATRSGCGKRCPSRATHRLCRSTVARSGPDGPSFHTTSVSPPRTDFRALAIRCSSRDMLCEDLLASSLGQGVSLQGEFWSDVETRA
jgi:hypothetical protein